LNPQPSILSQKREVVRSSLAHIALDLFADFGFDGVTVEEIASAAGISSRTVFREQRRDRLRAPLSPQ